MNDESLIDYTWRPVWRGWDPNRHLYYPPKMDKENGQLQAGASDRQTELSLVGQDGRINSEKVKV